MLKGQMSVDFRTTHPEPRQMGSQMSIGNFISREEMALSRSSDGAERTAGA